MKLIEMKKDDVLQYLTAPKVAQHLQITRQAVYQWGQVVPEKSALILAKFFPEIPHKVFIEIEKKSP